MSDEHPSQEQQQKPKRKDVVINAPLMDFSIEPEQSYSNHAEEVKPTNDGA